MLSRATLIEEAKLLQLPLDKQRAIIREYVQTIILKAIYQSVYGRKIFFMGGTALRFAYGLKRFSEDLDFNAKNLSVNDFEMCIGICRKLLEKEGFKCETSYREKGTLLVGKLELLNALQFYGIASSGAEKLMIKLEINRPAWEMKAESAVINRFGYLFAVLVMSKGILFAEKLDAFVKRCRGRDVYDVVFLLQKKFPIDEKVLREKNWKIAPRKAILQHIRRIKQKELIRLAKQVEPFLIDEEEKDFVINAKMYIKNLL